jgi:hypothetical protein
VTSIARNVGVALVAVASVVIVEAASAATATQTCKVVKLNDAGSTDHGGSLPSASRSRARALRGYRCSFALHSASCEGNRPSESRLERWEEGS